MRSTSTRSSPPTGSSWRNVTCSWKRIRMHQNGRGNAPTVSWSMLDLSARSGRTSSGARRCASPTNEPPTRGASLVLDVGVDAASFCPRTAGRGPGPEPRAPCPGLGGADGGVAEEGGGRAPGAGLGGADGGGDEGGGGGGRGRVRGDGAKIRRTMTAVTARWSWIRV